jgi:DNA-binding beta-propeller fold protein YncE
VCSGYLMTSDGLGVLRGSARRLTLAGSAAVLAAGSVVVLTGLPAVAVATPAPWTPGTVFMADTDNHRVLSMAPGGPLIAIGTGLNRPTGVAVDEAGDVFITDTSDNRVVKVPADGGPQTIIDDDLFYP